MTKRKEAYNINKSNDIGAVCECPICKRKFIKSHYAQAFCCDKCKNKFHNDRKKGKRNNYFRNYNMRHPERLTRVGIDLEFEKWKSEYYRDSDCFGEIPSVSITDDELFRQYHQID